MRPEYGPGLPPPRYPQSGCRRCHLVSRHPSPRGRRAQRHSTPTAPASLPRCRGAAVPRCRGAPKPRSRTAAKPRSRGRPIRNTKARAGFSRR
ncbi:hypothetical protein F8O03_09585 [Pseudoclavibacter terrae]|uniref:Uncharacterized protein n=1 Tax=Pseudoclavibacter terrae TaxID=1530195 RepID=A0A7J5B1W2_9MICO|nr:hypothetical protein F8O03_09585 [Pseudoclavibacter terrae]